MISFVITKSNSITKQEENWGYNCTQWYNPGNISEEKWQSKTFGFEFGIAFFIVIFFNLNNISFRFNDFWNFAFGRSGYGSVCLIFIFIFIFIFILISIIIFYFILTFRFRVFIIIRTGWTFIFIKVTLIILIIIIIGFITTTWTFRPGTRWFWTVVLISAYICFNIFCKKY